MDIRDTNTINTNLIQNKYFIDAISHTVAERIPERLVHSKGAAAYGYFEVTHDITDVCNAKLFEKVGKKTPLILRFSPSIQETGGADIVSESRGCGIKFYTEDGNFDLVGFNTPVFFYKDPGIFAHINRTTKRNPSTNLFELSSLWEFIVLRPESLHIFLYIFSDFGLPNGYRHMPCFGIHTYEVTNSKGESHFIRFNFTTNEGMQSLTLEEATRLRATDPDYFVRDLYNNIATKNYPSWTLYIDVMSKEDLKRANFDPFDITRLWSKGSYKRLQVGRLVLNRNPKNFFSEVEQLALNPGNLIPGIVGPPDKLFQGRVIAYRDTQNHRLTFNHNNILVNQPLYAKTYNRDGLPPVGDNMKDIPNYYPNTFNGPIPIVDSSRPEERLNILESSAVDLGPSAEFYTDILNEGQRKRLINNIVSFLLRAIPSVQKRVVELLTDTNADLGQKVALGLLNANTTLVMPQQILYP